MHPASFVLTADIHRMVLWLFIPPRYCKQESIPWKGEGQPFFKQLQKEAMANAQELVDQIPEAAQRMWTSALTLRGREFCFILNAAVRSDDEDQADPTAGLTRAINQLCVTAGSSSSRAVHPPGNVCYRGGGFDMQYRSFYTAGKAFRQPVRSLRKHTCRTHNVHISQAVKC